MIFSIFKSSRIGAMPGRDQLLDRARAAIRLRDLEMAQAFVLENGASIWHDAACLNVLGLIAEAQGEWNKARRCWGRAVRADRRYQPALQNLRRYFELYQFGTSRHCVAMGDEPQLTTQGMDV